MNHTIRDLQTLQQGPFDITKDLVAKNPTAGSYELLDPESTDPVGFATPDATVIQINTPYNGPGKRKGAENDFDMLVNVDANVAQAFDKLVRAAVESKFPGYEHDLYHLKEGCIKVKYSHSDPVTRRIETAAGSELPPTEYSTLHGKTVQGRVSFRPVLFNINDKIVCTVRMLELKIQENCASALPSVGSDDFAWQTGAKGHVSATATVDGKLRSARQFVIPGPIRAMIFDKSELTNKYTMKISEFSEKVEEKLVALFDDVSSAVQLGTSAIFKSALERHADCGLQLTSNVPALPEGALVGGATLDSVTVSVSSYNFSTKDGEERCGVSCRVEAVQIGAGGEHAGNVKNMYLGDVDINSVEWRAGRNEGTYLPFLNGSPMPAISLQPEGGITTISYPPPPEDCHQVVDGVTVKQNGEPPDVFVTPSEEQAIFISQLDESARSFVQALYMENYHKEGAWTTKESDDDRFKLKMKASSKVKLNGTEVAPHVILNKPKTFEATVDILPRIYAPHMKAGSLKKGKKALNAGSSSLTLQALVIAVEDKFASVCDKREADGTMQVL